MPTSEARICKTLSSLELDFFSALQIGSQALVSFYKAWTLFNAEVENCVENLSQDTLWKIYSFATTANVVAATVLDIDTAGEQLHSEFQRDVTNILREEFSNLSINDKTEASGIQATAAYIPLAYKWLLENLHNPYPTKEIRTSISTSTSSSLKDIDAWFTDARKRIGWNQLRKDHFPKRSDLIKAATRFFKPTQTIISSSNSLKTTIVDSIDYANQFVQIEDRARDLYSSKLFPSHLASDIEKTTSLVQFNAKQIVDEQSDCERSSSPEADGRSSYPSPAYSPGPSSPSPSPDYVERIGQKRKQFSSSELLSDVEETAPRASKRIRSDSSKPDTEAAVMSLPSPAASLDDFVAGESSSTSIKSSMPILPSIKRKRALSDVEDRPSKRSSNMMAFQRFQTVTDPLPFSIQSVQQTETVSDAWFAEIFAVDHQITDEIPLPVNIVTPDELSEVVVDVHRFDFASSLLPQLSPDGADDFCDSESPIESPELGDDLALPQPQIPIMSNPCGNEGNAFDFISVLSNDYDFNNMSFDIPEYLQPTIADTAETFSNSWMNDFSTVDNIQPNLLWSIDHISINPSTFDLSGPSNISFLNPLSTQLPAPLTSDFKNQLIRDELQRKIAEVQVLQAELEQAV